MFNSTTSGTKNRIDFLFLINLRIKLAEISNFGASM